MKAKKTIAVLLVSILSICLFFVFGFQIDVAGGITTDGGTADITMDPAKVAADLANAAVEEAELALQEAVDYLALVQAVHDAEVALLGLPEDDDNYEGAVLALEEAKATLMEVQPLYEPTPEWLQAELEAALKAVEDADAALQEANLAAGETNAAYSGEAILSEEELAELQKAVDDARKALEDTDGLTEKEIEELKEELEKAEDALEDAQSGEEENGTFHIVTNSNNGGSFDIEGIYFGSSGEIENYTFDAEEGYELAWLRIGNTKIYPDELGELYGLSFDRKNLVMHAHFKKIKDYEPEDGEIITTDDEGGPEDDAEPEDEKDKGKDKDNGNGRGKGKDKEKSNNGKKKNK